MAEVKWIKITIDMFDHCKIKHLRRLPDGNNIVLIWVMLLTMAGRCNANGMIFLTENIPYTPEMLADELGFEVNTVRLALDALNKLNMIVTDGNFFSIAGWEERQNTDRLAEIREYNRIAQQKSRAKRKALEAGGDVNDKSMTSQRCHDTDIDKDIDIEIDKDKKKNKKKESKIFSDIPELNQAILSFVEFRKSIKKPMTDRAIELLIKKLNGMTLDIDEQIEIINQSIMNGWQGIFPLTEKKQPIRSNYQKPSKAEELDQFYNMAAQFGSG
jgi:predicted phage replisome organizer